MSVQASQSRGGCHGRRRRRSNFPRLLWMGKYHPWDNTYAARTDPHFGKPYYPARAYAGTSPYYGNSGWEDYSGRNFLKCVPGTMTKLDDGQMYRCQ